MSMLFKMEFIRYRLWTVAFSVLMLLMHTYLSLGGVFNGVNQAEVLKVVAIVISAAFGLVQFILHKRINHWTYLIHRPLKIKQIYHALVGVGLLNIVIVTVLPYFLVLIGKDVFTTEVVDNREYTALLFILSLSMVAYLISVLVALSPNYLFVLLYLSLGFVLLSLKPSNTLAQFLPPIIVVALMVTLTYLYFKPDLRDQQPTVLTAPLLTLPLALGIHALLVLAMLIVFDLPRMMLGIHPNTNPPEGSLEYIDAQASESDRLRYILKGSNHRSKENYIRQVELADKEEINMHTYAFPFRGQIETSRQLQYFDQSQKNTEWTFSHDDMLYQGRHWLTGEIVGYFGVKGFASDKSPLMTEQQFKRVPLALTSNLVVTNKTLYWIDVDENSIIVKLALEGDEQFLDIVRRREHYAYALTNRRVLLFDNRELFVDSLPVTPSYSVPLPSPFRQVSKVTTYRLVDGYLFTFTGRNLYGFDQPGVEIAHARIDGTVEPVYSRQFNRHTQPAWLRHNEEMLSPVMMTMVMTLMHWMQPDAVDNDTPAEIIDRFMSLPVQVWVLIILWHSLSALGAWWISRKHQLSTVMRATWISLSGIFGLAALICCYLLNRSNGHKPVKMTNNNLSIEGRHVLPSY